MATGNTQVGYGTTLKWNAIPIAKLTKIGEFGFSVDKIDVSTFDAASAFKVIKAGLIDPGEISFEGVAATDDTTGLMAAFTDCRGRTTRAAIVTMPTSLGTFTFTVSGFLSEMKLGDITPDGIITIKGKITCDGATTLASAA
jgi:hypothetical protein